MSQWWELGSIDDRLLMVLSHLAEVKSFILDFVNPPPHSFDPLPLSLGTPVSNIPHVPPPLPSNPLTPGTSAPLADPVKPVLPDAITLTVESPRQYLTVDEAI